ncbi:MAG: hypothetical protein H6905_01695 [Hyphomicrobiales bacterium]|nr:hypothetical protein [Hyphomicrobiales bacterium]
MKWAAEVLRCATVLSLVVFGLAIPAAADSVQIKAWRNSEGGRVMFQWPAPVKFETSGVDGQLTVTFERPIDADFAPVEALPQISGKPSVSKDRKSLTFSLAGGVHALAFGERNRVVLDLIAPHVPSAPSPRPQIQKTSDTGLAQNPSADGSSKEADAHSPPLELSSGEPPGENSPANHAVKSSERIEEAAADQLPRAQLGDPQFDWYQPVPAALFRYAGAYWALFEAPSKHDVNALNSRLSDRLLYIEQWPHPDVTLLKFDVREGFYPFLQRNGTAWIISFAEEPLAPQEDIPLRPVLEADGKRHLKMPSGEAGTPFPFRENPSGQNLIVTPVLSSGVGVARAKDYPEFLVLRSEQGIVVEPHIDVLNARIIDERLVLSSPAGLNVTVDGPSIGAAPDVDGTRFVDFSVTSLGDKSFAERKQDIERAAASAYGQTRERARFRMCEFTLAHALASECLGALQLIGEDRPEAKNGPRFRFLHAAASALMGRYDAALEALQATDLANTAQGLLWRFAVSAMRGEHVDMYTPKQLDTVIGLLGAYPGPLRLELGRDMADALIDQHRLEHAKKLIDLLRPAAKTVHARPWIPYLEGRVLTAIGEDDRALTFWAKAENGRARAVHVRTIYARVMQALKRDQISKTDAAHELDILSAAWRGDLLEFKVLRELGSLQVATGKYALGLRTWHSAVSRYPNAQGSAEVAKEMATTFRQLFSKDEAERLPALKTIALYNDFSHLIPRDGSGQDLLMTIVDRFLELDLLAEADKILVEQIKISQSPQDRARLGLKLADIRALDARPAAAISALDLTAGAHMSDDLISARRLRRAEALFSLDRDDEALTVLGDDQSIEAERLRARIHRWRHEWASAGKSFHRVLDLEGAANAPVITSKTAETVVDLAAVLTLAHDDKGVAKVRKPYKAKLPDTAETRVFPLISGEKPSPVADVDAIEDFVEDAMQVRRIMSAAH